MSLKLSTSDDAKSHWSWCVCVAAWSQRAGRQAKEFAPVIVLVIQLLPVEITNLPKEGIPFMQTYPFRIEFKAGDRYHPSISYEM